MKGEIEGNKRVKKATQSSEQSALSNICRKSIFSILQIQIAEPTSTRFSKYRFAQLRSLHTRLASQLTKCGYTHLTPIQLKAYSALNGGSNALLRSVTGSGKTLAYLVPLFNRLIAAEPPLTRAAGVRLLVLAPTHELCRQLFDVFARLAPAAVGAVAGMFSGGEDPKKEKARVRKGLVVVFGTPGRVLYHIQNTRCFSLATLDAVVLDECDRALDLGFGKAIEQIFEAMGERRAAVQKAFVASCISDEMNSFVSAIAGDFRRIGFEGESAALSVPTQLKQYFVALGDGEKPEFLLKTLAAATNAKTIVFFSTADQVNFFFELIQSVRSPFDGNALFPTPPIKLHGYMQHADRRAARDAFAAAPAAALLTTDVSARGLDFAGVALVVLYDPPPSPRDYVNRVGRTARMFAGGAALSFVFEAEQRYAEQLASVGAARLSRDALSRLVAPFRWDLQVRRAVADGGLRHIARRAFVSFCRAYSLHADRESFRLKALNLHALARGHGLEGAKAGAETAKDGYARGDAKQISNSEQRFIDGKRRAAQIGARIISRKSYSNMEFM